jgi:hypothetical protein
VSGGFRRPYLLGRGVGGFSFLIPVLGDLYSFCVEIS